MLYVGKEWFLMKSKRYLIIITWVTYDMLMKQNKTTVIDVEKNMIEKIISILPFCEIAKITIEENNNEEEVDE